MPGIVVPESVQERYAAAGTDARDVGRELGQELIAHAREVANGVYVVAPFRQPLNVVELLPERLVAHAGLGRHGVPADSRKVGADDRGRDGVAARRAPLLCEDRRLDAAASVDHGATGVAFVHRPATAVIARSTGPPPSAS